MESDDEDLENNFVATRKIESILDKIHDLVFVRFDRG